MLKYARTFEVGACSDAVYDLINDIDAYPQFISAITGIERLTGALTVVHYEYGLWSGCYRCEILRLPKRQIRIQSCDENIEHMDCTWDLTPGVIGTSISFKIHLRLRSVMLRVLLQTVFPKLAEMIFRQFAGRLESVLRKPAEAAKQPVCAICP